MVIFLRALSLCLFLLLNACALDQYYAISAPTTGVNKNSIDDHYIKIEGLKIHVQPHNEILTKEVQYIWFVPISFENKYIAKYSMDDDLIVDVYFLTESEKYEFTPKDISISIKGSVPISPEFVEGPFSSIDSYGPLRLKLYELFNFITCQSTKPRSTHNINSKIVIDKNVAWQCYKLYFKTDRHPNPEDNILIHMNGIRKEGIKIDVPSIEYIEGVDKQHFF